jgi:hypothetical protein
MADQDPNGIPPPAEEENVDQFYDDGGETFLPADHVSAAPLESLATWLETCPFSVTDGLPIAVSPYSP